MKNVTYKFKLLLLGTLNIENIWNIVVLIILIYLVEQLLVKNIS